MPLRTELVLLNCCHFLPCFPYTGKPPRNCPRQHIHHRNSRGTVCQSGPGNVELSGASKDSGDNQPSFMQQIKSLLCAWDWDGATVEGRWIDKWEREKWKGERKNKSGY